MKGEGYQKIDSHMGGFEQARHVDDVVGALRVTNQNQRTGAASRALAQDFGGLRSASSSARPPPH
jgi:hypothetical protein